MNLARIVVLTIPVAARFAAIEASFEDHANPTRSKCLYTNVYADDGESTLE